MIDRPKQDSWKQSAAIWMAASLLLSAAAPASVIAHDDADASEQCVDDVGFTCSADATFNQNEPAGYSYGGFSRSTSYGGFGVRKRRRKNGGIQLPFGVKLDGIEAFTNPVPGLYSANQFFTSSQPIDLGPVTGNPDTDSAAIEQALRNQVDGNPNQFGVSGQYQTKPSSTMFKVHVQYLQGQGNQADTYIAVFRRVLTGQDSNGSTYLLMVDSANMRFHIKVLNGSDGNPHAMVMAVQTDQNFAAPIDPSIMTPQYSDDQLQQIANNRMNRPLDPASLQMQSQQQQGGGDCARKLADHLTCVDANGDTTNTDANGGAANSSTNGQDPAQGNVQRPQVQPPQFLTRSLSSLQNSWHAVNIYQAQDLKGNDIVVMVDVNSGQAWAFNADEFHLHNGVRKYIPTKQDTAAAKRSSALQPGFRSNMVDASAMANALTAGGINGTLNGIGNTLNTSPAGLDGGPLGQMPLSHATILDGQGNVLAVTNPDGTFALPASAAGQTATFGLTGTMGNITDELSSDPAMTQTVTPQAGQPLNVVLDPKTNRGLTAAINGFGYTYKLMDYYRSLFPDPLFDVPLAAGIHVNGTEECGNAFYDPASDGFFLMKSCSMQQPGPNGQAMNVNFENTAQPSIIDHEFTHRYVQRGSQLALASNQMNDPVYRFVLNAMDPVMDSATNEATADIGSMYARGNPVLGNGFMINPPQGMGPNIIRTGLNQTQYNPRDPNQAQDPHSGGEPFMGTAWLARQGLVNRYGAQEGPVRAALYFLRTALYYQPGDVVSAINQAALASVNKDGSCPDCDIIGSSAGQHGVSIVSSGQPGS